MSSELASVCIKRHTKKEEHFSLECVFQPENPKHSHSRMEPTQKLLTGNFTRSSCVLHSRSLPLGPGDAGAALRIQVTSSGARKGRPETAEAERAGSGGPGVGGRSNQCPQGLWSALRPVMSSGGLAAGLPSGWGHEASSCGWSREPSGWRASTHEAALGDKRRTRSWAGPPPSTTAGPCRLPVSLRPTCRRPWAHSRGWLGTHVRSRCGCSAESPGRARVGGACACVCPLHPPPHGQPAPPDALSSGLKRVSPTLTH